MKITFVVYGQPVPYTRTTQKSKFISKRWKKYADYKAKIQASFLNSIQNAELRRNYAQNMVKFGKPLNTGEQKIYVNSVAYFSNKRHGDPDNTCIKNVLDALFVSDKYIAGTFDFYYSETEPRLEIELSFEKS